MANDDAEGVADPSQHSGEQTPVDSKGVPFTLTITGVRKDPQPYACSFFKDPRDPKVLRDNREKLHLPLENAGVLVIYSGGTIGSAPGDDEDPLSPQIVKPWPVLRDAIPAFYDSTPQAINFRIDAVAFDKALDSSDMAPVEWVAVAQLLKKYMDDYEGFVVAHGTDTMVYSASALSFMLENLKKPVIVTGSQLSAIGNVRNDAQQNLITAILIADAEYGGIPVVPEVCIFFRDKLLRGNRSIKVDSDGFVAYESPNYPPLGEAGSSIVIHDDLLLEPDDQPFGIRERLDTNVIDLGIFPGIQDQKILGSVLETKGLRAVVLRTYGAGNTPTAAGFLEQLEVASGKGVVVVNVTQCARGRVQMGLYETSALLMRYGVVSGVDITAEAALTKLMVLLGDDNLVGDEIPRAVQLSRCGEQTESIHVFPLTQDAEVRLDNAKAWDWSRTHDSVPKFDLDKMKDAVLVLHSASVTPRNGSERLEISVYLNVANTAEVSDPKRLAISAPRLATSDGTLVFNVASAFKKYVRAGDRNSFRVDLGEGATGSLAWKSADLAVYMSN